MNIKTSHNLCTDVKENDTQISSFLSKLSFYNRKLFSCIAAILLAVFLISTAVLLAGCSASKTSKGAERGSDQYPNIPIVLDQYESWDKETFAKKMNLQNTSGSSAVSSEAPGLARIYGADTCFMSLYPDYDKKNGWRVIQLGFTTQDDSIRGSDAYDSLIEMSNYEFSYEDAIGLLKDCGISEGKIKVYDDEYSKGYTAETGYFKFGSSYSIAGEASTDNGESLYFAVTSDASLMMPGNSNSLTPIESVTLLFSSSSPFSVGQSYSDYSTTSSKSIDDDDLIKLLHSFFPY